MSVHVTTTAIVTEALRFGTFVAIEEGRCRPDPDRTGQGGIAKRALGAGAREGYEAGETATILTDGGIFAELKEGTRWVILGKGRIAG